MKKRILIVTYHDGINYGAFLQVFSLQEYLTKILSIKGDIEISQFPNGFSNLTYLIKIDKKI